MPVLPAGALAAMSNSPLPYGEGMSRPEQFDGKDITYTREALAAKVQGTMLVKCTITRQGHVENCRVLKAVPHMEEAVVEALQSRPTSPSSTRARPSRWTTCSTSSCSRGAERGPPGAGSRLLSHGAADEPAAGTPATGTPQSTTGQPRRRASRRSR